LEKKTVETGVEIQPFADIPLLTPNSTTESSININFNQRTNPVKFEICTDLGHYNVTLTPPVGELLTPMVCNIAEFDTQIKKFGGMQDSSNITISNVSTVLKQMLTNINLAPIENTESGSFKFAAKTLQDGSPLLISLQIDQSSGNATCKVYSENFVLRPQILKLIVTILK